MARFTPQSLTTWITLAAPSGCCASQVDCTQQDAEEGATKPCLSEESREASLGAQLVRFGLDAKRTTQNQQGGGRKKWYPSRDGWFTIAELESCIPSAELEEGVYLVVFGTADGNPIETDSPLKLTLEWTKVDAPAGSNSPAAQVKVPKSAELHRVLLKRAELDNASSQTYARQARQGVRTGLRTVKEMRQVHHDYINMHKEIVDLGKNYIEQVGQVQQAAAEQAKRALRSSLEATPPEPLPKLIIESLTTGIVAVASKLMEARATSQQGGGRPEGAKELPAASRGPLILPENSSNSSTRREHTAEDKEFLDKRLADHRLKNTPSGESRP